MKHVFSKGKLAVVLVIFCINQVDAQTDIPKFEFGANIGFLVYQGDLTPQKIGSFRTKKLSIGLHASKLISPAFSIKGNLQFGKLEGNDALYDDPEYRQFRNFYFKSPLIELSGQFVWNILGRNYRDRGFSPFIFAGAGLSYLNVKRDWSHINTTYFDSEVSEVWAGLAIDTTTSVPKLLPVIPIGLGVKYFFTPQWAINAETSYRITSTDYLDGFSKAANPDKKDSYMNYSIGLIYRTGKKNRFACPVIRY